MIADICQLSLNDLIEIAIAYIEYIDIGCNIIHTEDIINDIFSNRSLGYRAIELIEKQRPEVLAYLPRGVVEMTYVRTVGDGVFVYARTSDVFNT